MNRRITAADRPAMVPHYRKTASVGLERVYRPFVVTTMKGATYVVDETNDNWENGYFIAWPSDGSDPYPVAPSFARQNYQRICTEHGYRLAPGDKCPEHNNYTKCKFDPDSEANQ